MSVQAGHCPICQKLLASEVIVSDGTTQRRLTNPFFKRVVIPGRAIPVQLDLCYGHGTGPNRAQRRAELPEHIRTKYEKQWLEDHGG